MTAVTQVLWSKQVDKQLVKLPNHIIKKFYTWVSSVHLSGIVATRKCSGYHDEPLKGDRNGQRSVRLNNAYRAIYIERNNGFIQLLEVIEVNKHEY
ncbi:MAG: hypothetical protein AABY53_05395 [Bdellovibrionota bacterium]